MESKKPGDLYCVVGAGIIGLWTALNLVREEHTTLLIEQFPVNHGRGSSHGLSRAFRMLDTVDLTALIYSMEEWKKLEEISGKQLFVQTGMINLGVENDSFLVECVKNLKNSGYRTDWLDPVQLKEKFPQVNYPGAHAVYDESAGILAASECLQSVRDEFVHNKGKVLHATVQSITVNDKENVELGIIKSTGKSETLTCKKVIVCAGPWISKLLPQYKLTTLAIPVTYWQEKDAAGNAVHSILKSVYSSFCGFPIIFNARYANVYAIPSYEYPGLVKVLYHGGPEAEPDARDQVDVQYYIDHVSNYVKEHFPRLEHRKPAIIERCMYTCTGDNVPILDKLDEGIIVGTGFSGSGFKHSPAVGKVLAFMALDREDELPAGLNIGSG